MFTNLTLKNVNTILYYYIIFQKIVIRKKVIGDELEETYCVKNNR